jgi:IS30 family transposase
MSYTHLTTTERGVIWRMKISGTSQAEIARCVGRSAGTISRELGRNCEADGRYFSDTAQALANARKRDRVRRPCTGRKALMDHVEDKLQARWSPEQIVGRLEVATPAHLAGASISHMTIYRWIWACPERAQRLRPFLRVAHKKRRKPYGKPSKRGQIPNRVSIEERPAVVE